MITNMNDEVHQEEVPEAVAPSEHHQQETAGAVIGQHQEIVPEAVAPPEQQQQQQHVVVGDVIGDPHPYITHHSVEGTSHEGLDHPHPHSPPPLPHPDMVDSPAVKEGIHEENAVATSSEHQNLSHDIEVERVAERPPAPPVTEDDPIVTEESHEETYEHHQYTNDMEGNGTHHEHQHLSHHDSNMDGEAHNEVEQKETVANNELKANEEEGDEAAVLTHPKHDDDPKQEQNNVTAPTMGADEVTAFNQQPPLEPPAQNDAAAGGEVEEEEEQVAEVWEPNDQDVLSGRGASVNAHGGNKTFRALCFARKPEFDAGNHAAKRRVATEIVATVLNGGTARFLKRKQQDKGPWYVMTTEQAILKACQVMRDYKRPDRIAIREMMNQSGKERKRNRQTESTPMLDIPVPTGPLAPIVENPYGVHEHDVLSGRGAFVNGHVGNQRLRTLALERKAQFDAGNYTEKRALATEIVQIIKSLDPPGRFMKKLPKGAANEGQQWEELNDEKSIHKACQVMRDIDRPDRQEREVRRATKKKQKLLHVVTNAPAPPSMIAGAVGGDGTATTATIIAPVDDSKAAINAAAVAAAVAMATGDAPVIIKDAIESTTASATTYHHRVDASAMSVLAVTTTTVAEEERVAIDDEDAAAAAAAASAEEALDNVLDAVPTKVKSPPRAAAATTAASHVGEVADV